MCSCPGAPLTVLSLTTPFLFSRTLPNRPSPQRRSTNFQNFVAEASFSCRIQRCVSGYSAQWRTEGVGFGGFKPPPPPSKFRRPSKIVPNSARLWKLLKIAEFRTPTPQDVWQKGSKILKLPSVRNCFTLAMTNILFVIINSLKVPQNKKILLYEMKFLVRNYSCLQNPWLGDYRHQIPVLSVLNWICWLPPEQNTWVRHWPGSRLIAGPYKIKPILCTDTAETAEFYLRGINC